MHRQVCFDVVNLNQMLFHVQEFGVACIFTVAALVTNIVLIVVVKMVVSTHVKYEVDILHVSVHLHVRTEGRRAPGIKNGFISGHI